MAISIVQHRRGAEYLWEKLNLIVKDGELIIVEFNDGSRKYKIGSGKRFKDTEYLDQEINNRLDNLFDRVNSLKAITEEHGENIAGLENEQKDIQKSIETLQQEIVEINKSFKVVPEIWNAIAELEKEVELDIATINANAVLEARKNKEAFDAVYQKIQDTATSFEKALNDIDAGVTTEIEALSGVVTTLDEQIDLTNDAVEEINKDLREQAARIDSFITLPEGSTTSDAELIDIRVGYDGIMHATAGEAVRNIGFELEELKESLPSYIPDNAVDGLLYENNMLSLTSKGEPVGEPVEIKGGGGGSGSISVVKLTNENGSNTLTFAVGTKAELKFSYDSIEEGVSTGAGTCVIQVASKTVKTFTVNPGLTTVDVAEFLTAGANKVRVTCSDQYGASRSLTYTVTIIDLRITSTFDDSSDFTGDIIFKYTPFGAIEKTVHILIDDKEVSSQLTKASGKQATVILPKQTHGSHIISAYISAVLDETEIFSNTIYFDIACIEEGKIEPIICSMFTETETTQGNLVSIPYRVYDPMSMQSNIDLIVSSIVSGQEVVIDSTKLAVDRSKQLWNVRNYPVGTTQFTISYTYDHYGETRTITKSHRLLVNVLDIDVEAETNDLQIYLTSSGRSNSEQNPANWTFGDYKTTFDSFNWKSNGWVLDNSGDVCLRLNGDATATINIKPFEEDFKAYGKTFEFDFVVRDVNNRDAEVIKCFQDGRGFIATADTATLKSSGTTVSCNYKDEERVRVSVTIESTAEGTNFVSMYVNGILSSCQRYANTDNFTQSEPVYITLGSPYCGLDIYNIRIYTTALPTAQVLENSIADMSEPLTKLELFTDNDIYDENTGLVSYEKVKDKIPVITFTGDMPKFKGDKKKNSVRMKFEHPDHPELNFDELLAQIDVQGTSSAAYARKNWKVKLNEKRPHMVGAIPAKVFCIKVDYAEATGTHNTQAANFIETLYDRSVSILPAQDVTILDEEGNVVHQGNAKADERVRTTIQGFPCIVFEKTDENATPVFSSKGNFNYDKDAENAFGFTDDFDVECWEFCNNTSGPCNFLGKIEHPEDINTWITDFEPRYAQIPLLDADGNAVIYDGDPAFSIARFKQMHDWVCSTATYTVENGQRIDIVPKLLSEPVTYGKTTYTMDNKDYRLAKFTNEFEDYFDMHYMSIYYVFTFFALMTDQRAKNMFLTYWGKTGKWYGYFYDNDTIFGINNEGARVFGYGLEDTDQQDNANVFNGQNSVLWNNFRVCFPDKIKETYADLRNNKKLTYDKLVDQFITQGSDQWSASIYNEDAEYKYITMARPDAEGNIDASNLYQIKGSSEQHFKYFVDNRLNYCDSKWYAGDYPSDFIFLRIYTPVLAEGETLAVPANPNITITPFSDMYAGVQYKLNGTLLQKRVKKNESVEFTPPKQADGRDEVFNDTETSIYGASEISSLGDLSGLYCGVINVAGASKLTELIIGNHTEGYQNENFREISVGSNRLLRKIDLTNCSGLGIKGESPQTTLDVSGCPNLEEIYTEGTSLQSVSLPESGYIKILHLPTTLNSLTIKNQLYIDELKLTNYSNIKTLNIENCPTLNELEMLSKCKDMSGNWKVDQVRLVGIKWTFDDTTFLKSMFSLKGIDDKGLNSDSAWLVGTCHIKNLTGEEYNEIKTEYPHLDITYDELTSEIIFMAADGKTELYRETIKSTNSEAANCEDPVERGLIEIPTKDSTDKYSFTWDGWSRSFNTDIIETLSGDSTPDTAKIGETQKDALLKVTSTRILYPTFIGVHRSYPVTFINVKEGDNIVLQTTDTLYGRDAQYTGETPKKQNVIDPDFYKFTGWEPKPEKITGALQCFAQFMLIDDKWYSVTLADMAILYDAYGEPVKDAEGNIVTGYLLNETDNTLSILDVAKAINTNPAIRIPINILVRDKNYTITSVTGFESHNLLELLDLQEGLKIIDRNAFKSCTNLSEIKLPNSITSIEAGAFQGCNKIKEVYIPVNVVNIGDTAFAQCKQLSKFIVDENNSTFIVDNNCLINNNSKRLIQGTTESVIPEYIKTLGDYCFANTDIVEISVPENISIISNNAFSNCAQLERVVLPDAITKLDATCFAWCRKLQDINLPEGLTHFMTYALDSTALEDIVIPSTVTEINSTAFGEIKTLKTVTFKKSVDANGNIKYPRIHMDAFIKAGTEDSEIIFNVPWSEAQAKADLESLPENQKTHSIGYAPWGALGKVTINYDYKEEV